MVPRLFFLILFAIASASAALGQIPATLDRLSWLSGCWEGQRDQAKVEEIWSKPAGKSMIGLGRTTNQNRTLSFEFMQFREENGTLVFLPQPGGGAQVRFPLKSIAGETLTFENLAHDFPQRVFYQRKGNLLLAGIEGTMNKKFSREEFQMRRVRCN